MFTKFDPIFANQIGGYPMGAIVSTINGSWISKIDNNLDDPEHSVNWFLF